MTYRKSNKKLLAVAIGSTLLAAGTTAVAQESSGIQEVVVTAEKREESLQNTPIAISAMTAETLANMGITSFEGVAKASPSISFTPYPSSSNILILYMRGQGVSDPAQITSDGSVGLYEDGFYISRPQAATFDLADLERVEVLRGPQGTLYGRNTTGGAVNLISKKPTGEFGFKQSLTFGSRNLFRSLTTVDLPKFADVSTKFTLLKSSKDGFVKNTGNSHDFGEEEQKAGRFALRWDGLDDLTVDYFFEKGELDSTPVYYQNPNHNGTSITVGGVSYPYHGDANQPASRTYRPIDLELSTSDFEAHGLTVAWDASDALTIKSLTGYRKLNWQAYQDYAEGFFSFGFPLSFRTDDFVDDHQFSQEFQFIGNIGERIKYVAGLYYFEEQALHYEALDTAIAPIGFVGASERLVTTDAKSKAVYGQLTWTPPILDDRFDVTVGARYTEDDRSANRDYHSADNFSAPINEVGASNDQDFKRFNPSLTVNFSWTDDLSTYAKVATGYKAGGSSESGVPPLGRFDLTFKPEKVVSYELGMKSYWLDRRVRLNAAAFESRFDDMQLAFVIDPNNSGVVQGFNAGKATVQGVELELLVMPIDDLTLGLDYAYLRPKFKRVDAVENTIFDTTSNPSVPYAAGDNIKDLFVLPYAPRDTIGLSADYTFLHFASGTLAAHLDYRYQSKIYDTATAGPAVPGRDYYAVPGYGLFNGRLTLAVDLPRGDKAKVAIWGKNLTNKEYRLQVTGNGGPVPVGATPAGFNSSAETWAEPASYGLDLVYEY
jgi:iron complex outermembrane recepter protein